MDIDSVKLLYNDNTEYNLNSTQSTITLSKENKLMIVDTQIGL